MLQIGLKKLEYNFYAVSVIISCKKIKYKLNWYGKCSNILNFSLSVLKETDVFRGGIHKMLIRIVNEGDPDQTASLQLFRSSLIWVCTVCLGLFDRQLMLEI